MYVNFVEAFFSVLLGQKLKFPWIPAVEQEAITVLCLFRNSDKEFYVWFRFIGFIDEITIVRKNNQLPTSGYRCWQDAVGQEVMRDHGTLPPLGLR